MNAGEIVYDTGVQKIGEVSEVDPAGTVWLRPPGGGAEWTCTRPSELRKPTAEERDRAETLRTPVGGTK
ncbi:hypothetical protein FH965_30080 [Streptomyces spectabilis]|uniref:DUF1918 domain-containing protein n=1 Tax=Streptomyces spectabilis TaxID=68270 RepID=A0A516RLV5_STRST|nr:hypothetical protein FH965_30080 [Streptomyces spectabilis]